MNNEMIEVGQRLQHKLGGPVVTVLGYVGNTLSWLVRYPNGQEEPIRSQVLDDDWQLGSDEAVDS